jgi:hypothetical protein
MKKADEKPPDKRDEPPASIPVGKPPPLRAALGRAMSKEAALEAQRRQQALLEKQRLEAQRRAAEAKPRKSK